MIGFSAFHEFTPFAKESFLSFGTLLKNKPLYGLFPETALATLDGSNSLVTPFLPLIGKLFNSKLTLEYKKILFQLLKGDTWSTPVEISTILEEEKGKIKWQK